MLELNKIIYRRTRSNELEPIDYNYWVGIPNVKYDKGGNEHLTFFSKKITNEWYQLPIDAWQEMTIIKSKYPEYEHKINPKHQRTVTRPHFHLILKEKK